MSDGSSMLLTRTEFNREIARERIRATRRSIPFCVVTIDLVGRTQLRSRRRKLVRVLHRHVRLTDQKAELGGASFGVLLVDTSESGGRAVLTRLSTLCDSIGIQAMFSLKVHDVDGFDFQAGREHWHDGGHHRRIDDPGASHWPRIDSASLDEASQGGTSDGDIALVVKEPVQRSLTETSRLEQSAKRAHVAYEAVWPRVSFERRIMKRAVDVAGASIGLLMCSPVMIAAAVAIKLTSRGPVFFRQTREGLGGQPFTIYKMRTMEVDAESKQESLKQASHRDGPAFKIKQDPRVTKVGHILRKTCVDELPQFVNVLRGEMSLVGPRPLPWCESRACVHWQRRRLDVLPGMTCYWQVDKRAAETFDEWMRMDLRYVDRSSFWRDLALLARTVFVPLMGRGSD